MRIMKKNEKQIKLEFPPQSFPHLFWEQQTQAASVKDSRTMRWHPLIIKWCLYLQNKLSGAYDSGIQVYINFEHNNV